MAPRFGQKLPLIFITFTQKDLILASSDSEIAIFSTLNFRNRKPIKYLTIRLTDLN